MSTAKIRVRIRSGSNDSSKNNENNKEILLCFDRTKMTLQKLVKRATSRLYGPLLPCFGQDWHQQLYVDYGPDGHVLVEDVSVLFHEDRLVLKKSIQRAATAAPLKHEAQQQELVTPPSSRRSSLNGMARIKREVQESESSPDGREHSVRRLTKIEADTHNEQPNRTTTIIPNIEILDLTGLTPQNTDDELVSLSSFDKTAAGVSIKQERAPAVKNEQESSKHRSPDKCEVEKLASKKRKEPNKNTGEPDKRAQTATIDRALNENEANKTRQRTACDKSGMNDKKATILQVSIKKEASKEKCRKNMAKPSGGAETTSRVWIPAEKEVKKLAMKKTKCDTTTNKFEKHLKPTACITLESKEKLENKKTQCGEQLAKCSAIERTEKEKSKQRKEFEPFEAADTLDKIAINTSKRKKLTSSAVSTKRQKGVSTSDTSGKAVAPALDSATSKCKLPQSRPSKTTCPTRDHLAGKLACLKESAPVEFDFGDDDNSSNGIDEYYGIVSPRSTNGEEPSGLDRDANTSVGAVKGSSANPNTTTESKLSTLEPRSCPRDSSSGIHKARFDQRESKIDQRLALDADFDFDNEEESTKTNNSKVSAKINNLYAVFKRGTYGSGAHRRFGRVEESSNEGKGFNEGKKKSSGSFLNDKDVRASLKSSRAYLRDKDVRASLKTVCHNEESSSEDEGFDCSGNTGSFSELSADMGGKHIKVARNEAKTTTFTRMKDPLACYDTSDDDEESDFNDPTYMPSDDDDVMCNSPSDKSEKHEGTEGTEGTEGEELKNTNTIEVCIQGKDAPVAPGTRTSEMPDEDYEYQPVLKGSSKADKEIRQRITKLLNMGFHEGSNQNEAKKAMKMAQKLMRRHNLSQVLLLKEQELNNTGQEILKGGLVLVKIKNLVTRQPSNFLAWFSDLIAAVNESFEVESFYKYDKGKKCKVTFYGIYTNCQLAAYAFKTAAERISAMQADFVPEDSWAGALSSTRLCYAMGIARGLVETARVSSSKRDASENETAIVLLAERNRQVQAKALEEAGMTGKLSSGGYQSHPLNFDACSFQTGKEHSRDIDLNQRAIRDDWEKKVKKEKCRSDV